MNDRIPQDVTRTTLAVLFIGILIAASLWTVRPFLTPFIWATMVVVATWPLFLALQERLWLKRWLAVAVMTMAILLVFFLPLSLAIIAVVSHGDTIVDQAKALGNLSIPSPPSWLLELPFGSQMTSRWQLLAAMPPAEIAQRLEPYFGQGAQWMLAQAGSVGRMLLGFFLTVIIAAILFAKGEKVAEGALRFADRLAGEQGREAAILAAKSVRAVALGVVLTGFIQAGVGGIGLFVTGVPAAAVLTGLIFILCLAQVGPAPVLFPAVAWVYWSGDMVRGTILLVWAIFTSTFDNFLRAALIKKGADLPLTLIFPGVVGGLFAFGVIGLFIGPIVLAVTYTLLAAWVKGSGEKVVPGNGDEG